MRKLIVTGDKILLRTDGTWAWSGWGGALAVDARTGPLFVRADRVALAADLVATFLAQPPRAYVAAGLGTPGALIPLTLTVEDSTLGLCWLATDQAVVVETTRGRFQMTVTAPATTPPASDARPVLSGSWTIRRPRQQAAGIGGKGRRTRKGASQHAAGAAPAWKPAPTAETPAKEEAQELPVIDAHCHSFGQEIARSDIYTRVPAHETLYELGGLEQLKQLELLRHSYATEDENLDGVLRGLTEGAGPGAVVPLLMDMGYTPLHPFDDAVTALAVRLGALPRAHADDTGYFPPGVKYLWYERSLVRGTIDLLHDEAWRRPGRVWPFAPFDPRRPEALRETRRALETMGFAGVKLYARCGWAPDRNAPLHGRLGADLDTRLERFYRYVCDPRRSYAVVNHTSPGGWPPRAVLVYPRHFEQDEVFLTEIVPAGKRPPRSAQSLPRPAGADLDAWARWWVAACAYIEAKFCCYVQWTTSPYAWEGVLARHPDLRLNLAHAGSAAGVLVEYGTPHQRGAGGAAVSGVAAYLREHPMLGDADLFAPDLLPSAVADLAVHTASTLLGRLTNPTLLKQAGEALRAPALAEVRRRLPAYLRENGRRLVLEEMAGHWGPWLEGWRQRYPYGWLPAILSLMRRYPNVYADLSYFFSGDEANETGLLMRLASEVDAEPRLRARLLCGTDFYLTQRDGIDARRGWELLGSLRQEHPDLWPAWASANAIEYLNLRRRLPAIQRHLAADPAARPAWWGRLRQHLSAPRGGTRQ